MRQIVADILAKQSVKNFVTAVILFNAIILGMETSDTVMATAGDLLKLLDHICLAIFVIEIVAKIYAHRMEFFKSGWNIFDFLIISLSLSPSGEGFAVLRAMRILRLLRMVSIAPTLRRVVEAFVSALPGMASVFLLMGLIFYIASVMATTLFSEAFPQWFGSLGASAYSLFQIMTLESWSMGIVRPVMEVYPYAWMFFVPFILVTTFAVVNLVVGLVVNSMQDAHAEESNAATDDYRQEVVDRLDRIEAALADLGKK
mgnify:CR=1 FL=1